MIVLKKLFLICCFILPLYAEGWLLVGGSIDIQKAFSISQLEIVGLTTEKHNLSEMLMGGEIRLGYLPDKENRLYLAIETAHKKAGLHYYSFMAEYNRTPFLTPYWKLLFGGGLGYSFTTLDKENLTINDQSAESDLSFQGIAYNLKGGILFTPNRHIELEFAVKARHMILGKAESNHPIAPLALDMNKTFTVGAGVGVNVKF
ncbi:hypothetical protein CCZ01_01705 [Helicobacter monodelphidis]|uniref:hypothetical protein n=1 Tax=Helicobacter sp. 15-1451 TaxID=2004995 RepID=UPI000DCDA851|nr:hypothetical protein [Helicobacter sp. 15-1451]RAX58933.1 hypothetical protein CCZ01_01705 [Helicobacter sp. 15-1451]